MAGVERGGGKVVAVVVVNLLVTSPIKDGKGTFPKSVIEQVSLKESKEGGGVLGSVLFVGLLFVCWLVVDGIARSS
jgi:hypothetical protein